MRKKQRGTAGLLALLLSIPGVITAEERKEPLKRPPLSKEAAETVEKWERNRLGSLAFYVRPYLSEEEKKQVSDLIRTGFERSVAVEAKKYEESLKESERGGKKPNPPYILWHLWFLADPHLTKEERATVHKFIDQGFARRYQEPLSKWSHTRGDQKPLKMPRPSKSLKSEEVVREGAKEDLGHLWMSVRPFLKEEENKTLSEVILKGFDRYLRKNKEGVVRETKSSPSDT